MTYRDTREAAFARSESLQKQLCEARREIIRLRALQAAAARSAEAGAAPPDEEVIPAGASNPSPAPGAGDRSAVRHGLMAGFALVAISAVSAAGLRASRARYYETAAYEEMLALHAYHDAGFRYGGLHDRGFYDATSLTGHVTDVRGTQLVAAGANCSVRITPVSSPQFNCRVQVDCGGTTLYGAPRAGFTQCVVDEGMPVRANDPDPSTVEGDPEMDLDLPTGRLVVRDGSDGTGYSIGIALDHGSLASIGEPHVEAAPSRALGAVDGRFRSNFSDSTTRASDRAASSSSRR